MNILDCEAKELLKKLVSFPSLSTHEQDLADWLEQAVRDTDLLEVHRYGDNLLFSCDSLQPGPWLLLNSHSDVVPPSDQHHGDPFNPQEKDGCIWGRGTTDAKGSGTAMLKALLNLANSGWKPNCGKVSFALTICEETSGEYNGMAYLRSLIDDNRLTKPDAALIGEPTSLSPCIAQKGLLVVRLTVRGESGHAARVYGNNAIYGMADILKKLESIHFKTENPFIGKVKITPTRVEGGTVNNAMPEQVRVILDIRTIPEVPNTQIIQSLEEALPCSIDVVSDRFVSTQTDSHAWIARCARTASGKEYVGSPTASDWVFLSDIPVVKIGPGHSELSHKHNEHIEIAQLNAGVRLYMDIITSYFSDPSKLGLNP